MPETIESLPTEFVGAITAAQVEANKGWAPENTGLIDKRIEKCPGCGAPGMNTCWGYWAFTCGAEILSGGTEDKSCAPHPQGEDNG